MYYLDLLIWIHLSNFFSYTTQAIFKRDMKLCPIFSNLKTLVLNGWAVACELDALICFLQHAPILEKITLQLNV